jgi:2-succinyl-6-hydroxy-2,4-cyclohexadiene-1-carboxylate synthase
MTRLLALHGFTGSPASWERALAPLGGQPLVPALLGHRGALGDDAIDSFEAEVARIASLAAPHAPLHVAGYSLGARIALGLALRHRSLVSRLTLIGGHCGLASADERTERRRSDALWCDVLETRGLPAFVELWQAQTLWATQTRLAADLREAKQRERLSHTASGLARSLRALGLAEMPYYLPDLPQLAVPTILLAGGLDAKFATLAELMASQIPGSRVEIASGAGHDLLLERPQFVSQALLAEPGQC